MSDLRMHDRLAFDTPTLPGEADVVSAAISIRDLSVSFPDGSGGTRQVLSDVSLDIPAGQFTALVGRSGCGKTTLLNTIAGLVEPQAGEVSVLGKAPREARDRLGFMLARDALLPWRTARRNVEYGLELRGVGKAERRDRATDWLEKVHLGSATNLWPWQLSQGMRQRVALARTWVLDPEVLLMDEPFAALDANTRVHVQEEFLALWQSEEHRTVVFVTHDLHEAVALADRIVLMGDGQILEDVPVGIERPRDLARVAGDPQFQELHDHLRSSID
ncbi:ABC transporter ATP-binding protein [Rhodococcus sp. OK302]|uniref:ABC transporter ATP-binding protein n=1 Tax=Rhodococcus sp. OK302 TaxID=1882769 RepID=UPI000B9F6C34|nr:ABC transporter ATP-binding protein [Rhodococcus sp. OK302]OYD60730.1 NitT/TauT family transport system ATP-binding protein [Rhodococcus sp. OK302]